MRMLVSSTVRKFFHGNIARAEEQPIDLATLEEDLKRPIFAAKYRKQIANQTTFVPDHYFVSYRIEFNHPELGKIRHLAIGTEEKINVATPDMVLCLIRIFGFTGDVKDCVVYQTLDNDRALAKFVLNVIQPYTTGALK